MIPYHSGVPVEAWTEPVVREAAEGAEPEQLLAPGLGAASTARHNARLYAARREFEDARSQPEIRAAAPSGALAEAAVTLAVGASFWVHFWTPRWRPTHRVTIRCAEAGWTADIHGLYRFGGWHFEFGIAAFPAGITMKFVLDGTAWMDGFDHQLGADSNHHFVDAQVRFPDVPARVAIPFHNFTLDPDKDEQDLVGANRNSRIVYDVIVVGSGMGGGILADQLSDRGVRTLVLEAGGLTLPSHINNLPGDWGAMPGRYQVLNFENRDDSQFLFGVQMGLGGRSVFWSGLIPRMRPWEMTAWPSAVRTWLLADGYAHAERLMRKRETLGPFQDRLVTELAVALPEYEVSDQPRSQHQPNLGPGGVIGDVLESPTGTFSTADLLLDSLGHGNRAGRDNLTVNLHHLVRRVESNGPELATAVSRRSRRQRRATIPGPVHRPLRGIDRERADRAAQQRLPDPNHRIGRGLTDHPAFFSHPGRTTAIRSRQRCRTAIRTPMAIRAGRRRSCCAIAAPVRRSTLSTPNCCSTAGTGTCGIRTTTCATRSSQASPRPGSSSPSSSRVRSTTAIGSRCRAMIGRSRCAWHRTAPTGRSTTRASSCATGCSTSSGSPIPTPARILPTATREPRITPAGRCG